MMVLGNIFTKSTLRYMTTPEIRPRLSLLFSSGFQHVAYYMALIYYAVRLLPVGHPYIDPANMGRFGIRHVTAAAANNLVFKRQNIDQIIVFGTILTGLVLICAQLVLLGMALFVQPALAAFPASFAEFFVTPAADRPYDIALMMMDMVFGIPGLFESCVSTNVVCEDLQGQNIQTAPGLEGTSGYIGPMDPQAFRFFPFPVHLGLHQMFLLYSLGMMVIAVIISMYFLFAVVAETAQTGTAFGKRFNKVWAPLRFVIAFGLLVPVSFGLNSAQYIVLYAAKFGSSFATNGWNHFNDVLNDKYLGHAYRLVATPNVPEVSSLLQFYFLARTCAEMEEIAEDHANEVKPYIIRGSTEAPPHLEVTSTTTYEAMQAFTLGASTVTIRFGVLEEIGSESSGDSGAFRGSVRPLCGEVKLSLSDVRRPGAADPPQPGAEYAQRYYWFMVRELWFERAGTGLINVPNFPLNYVRRHGPWAGADPNAVLPSQSFKTTLRDFYTSDLEFVLVGTPHRFGTPPPVPSNAVQAQIDDPRWNTDVPGGLRRKGWAAAGVWYNRIAEMNGTMTTAVFNIPNPSRYPEVMELVRERNIQNDNTVTIENQFDLVVRGDRDLPSYAKKAEIYKEAYDFWVQDHGAASTHTQPTGNIIVDAINALFGTEGLYSMRRNPDVHPLAQLVGIGRAMIESTIRNFGYAVLGGAAGNIFGALEEFQALGRGGSVAAGFFVTIAMIGLTVGFVLFYIVPFLPFLYFMFAVSGWIKGIFEAMVGVPLWTLAHIRIDGEGLPGPAAGNGYYLVFEVFLRPILIVFGLLAGIMTFGALVSVLNQIFDLVTSNLTGFDVRCEETNCGPTDIEFYRSPIDEFFFTVMYAIIVYLMALSSFKLIDLVPNSILRWMGQSLTTFNDAGEDPIEGLISRSTLGTQQATSSLGGGLKGILTLGAGRGGG